MTHSRFARRKRTVTHRHIRKNPVRHHHHRRYAGVKGKNTSGLLRGRRAGAKKATVRKPRTHRKRAAAVTKRRGATKRRATRAKRHGAAAKRHRAKHRTLTKRRRSTRKRATRRKGLRHPHKGSHTPRRRRRGLRHPHRGSHTPRRKGLHHVIRHRKRKAAAQSSGMSISPSAYTSMY